MVVPGGFLSTPGSALKRPSAAELPPTPPPKQSRSTTSPQDEVIPTIPSKYHDVVGPMMFWEWSTVTRMIVPEMFSDSGNYRNGCYECNVCARKLTIVFDTAIAGADPHRYKISCTHCLAELRNSTYRRMREKPTVNVSASSEANVVMRCVYASC